MKKVYQKIDDPRHGDCFNCDICTLLGIDYDDVPNYVDCGDDWYIEAQKTFKEHGYNLTGMELWNPKVMYLENPTVNVFEDKETHVPSTFIALKREMGINGLFLASVYSPKYTNTDEHPIDHLHSVLCDFDFNIVFDPQPEYAKVVNYPYSKLIGYNGIRSIDIIKKIIAT